MLSLLYRWFRSPRSRLHDVTLGRRLGTLALWVMAVTLFG